jgi:hypothetical protein
VHLSRVSSTSTAQPQPVGLRLLVIDQWSLSSLRLDHVAASLVTRRFIAANVDVLETLGFVAKLGRVFACNQMLRLPERQDPAIT